MYNHAMHPKNPMSRNLIDQLVNPKDAQLSAGSNIEVSWQCPKDPRHIWDASPNTRKRSPKCPICINKRVLAGVNDIATTNPELAKQILNPQDAISLHEGSHTKTKWICENNPNHIWSASYPEDHPPGTDYPKGYLKVKPLANGWRVERRINNIYAGEKDYLWYPLQEVLYKETQLLYNRQW